MATIEQLIQQIEGTLRRLNRYDSALDHQIRSLAGVVRALDIANSEIDQLEITTVLEKTRYGEKYAPHPAFKVQRDAQAAVTKQMKALGLTSEDLAGEVETDPLIEMTQGVIDAGKRRGIVRPAKKK